MTTENRTADAVTFAATPYAYRVQVWAKDSTDGGPVEDYTGGNSRLDSAGFVKPDSDHAETPETMRRYAEQTAREMAAKWGVEPDRVGYDADEESALLDAYGPRSPRWIPDPELAPVVSIRPGDRVDLEGAPGWTDPEAEFELATCCGAERETADCLRLDFEGLASLGLDPALSLPVVKREHFDDCAAWEEEEARQLAEQGAAAHRAGVPWHENPHPSGSVQAYAWDKGHTSARRAG